jgi:hypothetical protein
MEEFWILVKLTLKWYVSFDIRDPPNMINEDREEFEPYFHRVWFPWKTIKFYFINEK